MTDTRTASVDRDVNDARKLWMDDRGTLKVELRRLLALLLKGPMLEGVKKRQLWELLLANENLVRSRLNDIFLDLIIDDENEIAFITQVRPDCGAPILIEREQLTFAQTQLFIILRRRYKLAEDQNERFSVTKQELLQLADDLKRSDTTNHVAFESRISSAIAKAVECGVLRRLRDEDCYEITPIIKFLVTPAFTAAAKVCFKDAVPDKKEDGSEAPGEATDDAGATVKDGNSADITDNSEEKKND